jgi:hypothetical protein
MLMLGICPLAGSSLGAQTAAIRAEVRWVLKGGDSTYYRRVVAGSHGTTLALNASGSVDVFDSTRTFRRTVGRRAEGLPANATIAAVGVLGDDMWVFDPGSGRSYVLDLDGHVLDARGEQPVAPPASGLYWAVETMATKQTRVWMQSATTAGIVRLMQEGRTILRTGAQAHADTVATLDITNAAMVLRSPAGDVWFRSQPWSAVDLVAFASGTKWGYILRQRNVQLKTRSARVTLERFSLDSGRPTLMGSIPYSPTAVAESMVNRMVDSTMPTRFADRFENLSAARRAVREVLFVPETLPFASKLIASDDGRLYIKNSERDWLVFDATRKLSWTLVLPDGVRLEDARGERLLGIRTARNGASEIVELRSRAP